MEDKNAKLKVTIVGQIAVFTDKTDDEIMQELITKVPEISNYRSHIKIIREGNKARIDLQENTPKWIAQKLYAAFL